ncbi:hypothetical protein BC628DRAFT_984158 [Trametes gibbosa]|nr:hypothetical protein BC628DRAFT_984158 [Trametes gibbosa]
MHWPNSVLELHLVVVSSTWPRRVPNPTRRFPLRRRSTGICTLHTNIACQCLQLRLKQGVKENLLPSKPMIGIQGVRADSEGDQRYDIRQRAMETVSEWGAGVRARRKGDILRSYRRQSGGATGGGGAVAASTTYAYAACDHYGREMRRVLLQRAIAGCGTLSE